MHKSLAVSHYLHLREQGMSHDRASAHTTQRFGLTALLLRGALAEARTTGLKAVQYIPPTCGRCDDTGERHTNSCGGGTMPCECAAVAQEPPQEGTGPFYREHFAPPHADALGTPTTTHGS